ncbi:outer membrane beta-barrel family protein [Mucilaginibacter terrae]|uniref:Ferric enterobactin receptor n=1 Tax=Mucilaginibacter terrae TaxID=1955052 RepID=A0ABU3GPW4_9SPHI|nr:outer membrane beta-barrel family protein [Mucilaginibacter terrae]MDT3401002.1 ferric enterobactin receptor [Mucilaginibacter terrae]
MSFAQMKWITTLLLALVSTIVSAQNKGKITGKIIDANSKAAIDYATVSIYQQGSEKPSGGTISDDKGNFTLDKLADGQYRVVVNFIGYQAYTAGPFNIKQSTVNAGSISLHSSSKQLGAVTVTAKTPIIENKIDKMVYNAANDITSQGGVALDVLKKVPQVSVDIDGNVELQGIASVRFLINGKPSTMFGSSLADVLASLPASQIKSIEVITSSGAKYDAQGLGGIINIILKDNKVRGINGTVNLSAGTRMNNGSANLNVRSTNFGISAFFSGNAQVNTRTLNLNDRTSTDASGRNTRLVQDGYSDFKRGGYESGINFDWSLSKMDNITGSLGYDHFNNQNSGLTSQSQQTNGLVGVTSQRNSLSKFNANSYDWSLDYKHKFKTDGQELELLYNSSFGKNNSAYNQSQVYSGQANPFSASSSSNPGTDKETNISIDYTHPLSKDVVFETGAKTVLQYINSTAAVNAYNANTNLYAFDPNQSYSLKYDRKIYAGYISLGFTAFHFFDIKAGGRLEHTDTHIDFPGTLIPSYNTWVPTAVISHKLSTTSTLKISYTKRVERAEYREINPFINLSDPYNITTGNPLLKPEIGNVFELGYNKSFEAGGNLYIALFSRHNTNDVKTYTNFYSEYRVGDSVYRNVSVTNRQNIGTEQNTGISISGSVPFSKKLNLRTNTTVTDKYIVNKVYGGPSVNAVVVRTNLNLTFQLSETFVAEAFGNYNSPLKNIQGRTPKFMTYNFAVRKQFMGKKASLGFTTTNPFAKYVDQLTTITQAATTNGLPYTSYNLRRVPYQSFGVSLSWRFGKLDFKKDNEQDNMAKPIDN